MQHWTIEDAWYSCPKSPEGCLNRQDGTACNCGADEHNAAVDSLADAALAVLRQAEKTRLKLLATERERDDAMQGWEETRRERDRFREALKKIELAGDDEVTYQLRARAGAALRERSPADPPTKETT